MIDDLEFKLAKHLKNCGIENSYLEARMILEKTHYEKEAFDLASRRCLGEPLAYILKERGFYRDTFFVEPGVLIPRPETETLVEEGVRFLRSNSFQSPLVYDFGCGSGCIGLSILKEVPEARLIGLDVSEKAFQISTKNAKNLDLIDRCEFICADVSEFTFTKRAHLVVANPPYIALDDHSVEENVKKFEPKEALFSGSDGLDHIKEWSKIAFSNLESGGILLMEFGIHQETAVRTLLVKLGFSDISIYKDLAGIYRSVSARKP